MPEMLSYSSQIQALEQFSKTFNPLPDTSSDKESTTSSIDRRAYTSCNRYGRPYISGRPLLTCDRKKIVELFEAGSKKIHIAKQLGITHSCVSKVLRRYHETGSYEARVCRTASCSCPGSADKHDARFCKHLLAAAGKQQQAEEDEDYVDVVGFSEEDNRRVPLEFSIKNLLEPHNYPVTYKSKQ